MRGYQIALVAAASALVAVAGTLVATGYVHFGKPGHGSRAAVSVTPVPGGVPTGARDVAATLEADPALAKRYAERQVGNCLENAWGNLGYTDMFDSYRGKGIVEFSTGTLANPTGNYASMTVIDVHVYTDGRVKGIAAGSGGGPPPAGSNNASLDYWGCPPDGRAASGVPLPVTRPRPPGLQQDGPLDAGCKLTGTRGYTSFQGVVTLYNPGSSAQSVSSFLLQWGSNGVLLSQEPISGSWSVPPGQDITLTFQAPAAATSCQFGGFNP